jgi:hypothetical protein
MNHGKCKNCWWYKMMHDERYRIIANRIFKDESDGICYMFTVNPKTNAEIVYYVNGGSWCPDYTNRKRTNKSNKMTLDEWLNNL